MKERIKQIPARLLEIWKKYTKKQKTIIISAAGALIVTFILLILLINRVDYVELMQFTNTKSASEATKLLSENGIAYKVKDDNLTIMVDANKSTEATFLISDSNISSDAKFSLEQLLDTDMSTTNQDKQLRLHLYYQSDLEELLKTREGIDAASVSYLPSDTRTSILETQKEIGCSIFLTINDKFNKSSAESIAVAVANSIGNETTDKIKIIDQYGNLLYNGPSSDEDQYANKTLEVIKSFDDYYSELVTRFGLMNGFDFVEPSFHLDVNMDKVTQTLHEYLPADGQEQGLYSTWSKITSENNGTNGDVAGTDSNDEVDYYIQDSGSGDSSYEEINITYTPSERLTETLSHSPVVNVDKSSVAIALKKVKDVKEEDLQTLGLLADTTFDEYVLNNSDPVQLDVNSEWYKFFADVTGIAESNISISMYEVTNFIPKQASSTNWDLILKLVLAALIIGLLVFVVFKGMSPVEVTEVEPELSVEQLLATTKENQSLDDIEFSEKSETKRMIEKFVDENPDAVAQLLRNWLTDGWD